MGGDGGLELAWTRLLLDTYSKKRTNRQLNTYYRLPGPIFVIYNAP